MQIPTTWPLTRAFFESFIDDLVGSVAVIESVDGENILKRKIIPPELKDTVKANFFAVFNEEWLEQNRGVSPGGKPDHPLVEIARSGLSCYLECIIGTFSWICQAGASWLITERTRTITGLRDTTLFHATLFELDILTYLLKSGAKVIADYKTSGDKDVEAMVELKGVAFLVECKILDEGGVSDEIRRKLVSLCTPFNSRIRMSAVFKKFPSRADLQTIEKAVAEAEAKKNSDRLELESGIVILKYGEKAGPIGLTMPEPDDERIKATLDKALSKVRNMKFPTMLFVKVDLGAGVGNAYRKLGALLQDKKYRKFAKVFVVNKIKSSLEGFDLEVYEIPNQKAEFPCKLTWDQGKRLFDIEP
jgi:hypothetical protein